MSYTPIPQTFPLSKTLDTADLDLLKDEVRMVEAYDGTRGQHPMRIWEYAMAHRAIKEWGLSHPVIPPDGYCIGDVGGAGSRFAATLRPYVDYTVEDAVNVLDPEAVQRPEGAEAFVRYIPESVESYAAHAAHDQYDCITCLSVIEHVPEVRTLLRACRMLLKPGGLLFLTTDYWDCSGEDTAHFHWMRRRIYNGDSIRRLMMGLRELGFKSFGRSDWKYNGNHLYGSYTFASLAMTRKP